MSVLVYLSLGSNTQSPLYQVKIALEHLKKTENIDVHSVSSIYRSAPWGGVQQPDFINAVVLAKTSLPPERLLAVLQNIEKLQGRVRQGAVRWGPRVIDIDILIFGEKIICSPYLQIPHPRITERDFVLFPLLELAPDLQLPTGERLLDYQKALTHNGLQRLFPVEKL